VDYVDAKMIIPYAAPWLWSLATYGEINVRSLAIDVENYNIRIDVINFFKNILVLAVNIKKWQN